MPKPLTPLQQRYLDVLRATCDGELENEEQLALEIRTMNAAELRQAIAASAPDDVPAHDWSRSR